MRRPKAGFVSFGEINTPREFIDKRVKDAQKLLEENGIDLVVTPPVSDDAEGKDVARAIADLSGGQFDLLILCVAGWIPSHAVVSIAMEFSHKPMILWGLTGWTDGGKLITTADQAGTTALRRPMEDMGFTFKYVYSTQDGGHPAEKIADFAQAAKAATLLRHARIGQMGSRDMNLYGTSGDTLSLRGQIGVEVEHFEMLEIVQGIEKLKSKDVQKVIDEIKEKWTFEKPAEDDALRTGVEYYLAIRDKVKERGYEALSLIDVDGMKKLAKFPPAMIFMLLSERENISTTPENDVLGNVTQLMTRYLTDQIGAYLEFYEFFGDRVLIGVPDYVPSEVVDGEVTVTPASFGNFSGGVLNISKVKTGRVTLARITYRGEWYSMHLVTGEAVTPRPWEEAGWTPPAPQLPSLEVILDTPVEDFAQNVLSQHYIISYGDNTGAFRDLCYILDIDII